MSFQAIRLPRANVVYELPGRDPVAELPTFEQAESHAADLNRWLESRPKPDRLRPFAGVSVAEPTEYELLALIDGLYDPEDRLEVLSVAISREAQALAEAA